MIIKPELPPAPQGYVEDVDENGLHYYRKTEEQYAKEQQQKTYENLVTENEEHKAHLAQSDEAAIAAFEAQSATDEAIIALYEKIGG